jgi:molybdate transport system substrate-binding protein
VKNAYKNHQMHIKIIQLILITSLFCMSNVATSAEITVAVASNFANTMRDLKQVFELRSSHRVNLVVGSTGRHYIQIKQGAPFDIFFAADDYRPAILEDEGYAIAGSRFSYAIGRLVLWSPKPDLITDNIQDLRKTPFNHIAIANPKLAPYGKATKELLIRNDLWGTVQGRMVRGENIGQTYQFVNTGSAELGFVALSQIRQPNKEPQGSYWVVPETSHRPINQQAVVIKDNPATAEFIRFVKSDYAKSLIRDYGYETP